MQGQPITLVGFTSFNEQLLRQVLSTVNPHRLIVINGRPPRPDYAWRELATLQIHNGLLREHSADNPRAPDGALGRTASTFDYRETFRLLEDLYDRHGSSERIVCAVTGSKLQTLGVYFAHVLHPDMQLDYPTPDSYFVQEYSRGVRQIWEARFENFKSLHDQLKEYRLKFLHGEPIAPDESPQTREL